MSNSTLCLRPSMVLYYPGLVLHVFKIADGILDSVGRWVSRGSEKICSAWSWGNSSPSRDPWSKSAIFNCLSRQASGGRPGCTYMSLHLQSRAHVWLTLKAESLAGSPSQCLHACAASHPCTVGKPVSRMTDTFFRT